MEVMRLCMGCKTDRRLSEFYRNRTATSDGIGNICKPCKRVRDNHYRANNRKKIRESSRRWHAANREQKNREARERARALRIEVLAAYGNQCACCGESGLEFLTIDHVDGNGSEHRRKVNRKVYADLKRRGFPSGFRVLCWNCNCAVGLYGACPHGGL